MSHVTITPDVDPLDALLDELSRRSRALTARARGFEDLAEVIERQEGAQAVRDGMGDVLHWLKECRCYTAYSRCDYLVQRQHEAVERMASSLGVAYSTISRAFEQLMHSTSPLLQDLQRIQVEDVGRTQAARVTRAGRAAQRSPYGPQGRR